VAASRFDPGFDMKSTAMASVNTMLHRMDAAQGQRAARRILEGAKAIPGVEMAALTSGLGTLGANGDAVCRAH
jgi:hypothetical protein